MEELKIDDVRPEVKKFCHCDGKEIKKKRF